MIDVPNGWNSAPLGSVCKVVSGATPKTGIAGYWGGDIGWVTPDDLSRDRSQTIRRGARSLTRSGYHSCSARLFPAGSVIYSSRAPIGYVAIAGTDLCTNQGCKTAVPPEQIDPRFLYWYLRWATPDIVSRASGTTFKEISGKRFAETTLSWPELHVQRRIVDILEDHLSRLDAVDRDVRVLQTRLRSLRLSGLRRIRERAEECAVIQTVGEIAETNLGKMLDAKRDAGRATPYLRNINVRWGMIDVGEIRTVPLSDAERARLALRPGDLLVCEGGEPGRCAIWRGPNGALMTFQKALHRVRVRSEASVSVEFVALMLEEFIRTGRGERLFTGTTIKHLPQEKLRSIEIPTPHIEDQHRAVRQIDELSSTADRLSSALSSTTTRSMALKQSILQAAFSGRLTGDATDLERAEESIA